MNIYNGTCGYCKKGIWLWERSDYLQEGYGDGKALCHTRCHYVKDKGSHNL